MLHRSGNIGGRFRPGGVVRWVVIVLVVGALVSVGGAVAWHLSRPLVTVAAVVEGPVVQAFYATGTLAAEREYPIRSNAPGYVTKVFVDKGYRVKAGDPLAVVTEDAVQFRFDQAKAELERVRKLADPENSPVLQEIDARIRMNGDLLAIAQREEKRLRDLVEQGGGSTVEWDRALDRLKTVRGELEAARALRKTKEVELSKDLEVAEAALRIAQWNVDRQTIRVPEALEEAVVLDRPAPVGTRVAVNDPLMLIADVRPERLVMRAQVDEEDVVRAAVGGKVLMTLYAYPGRTFHGKVKRIYDKADPDRRTFEVDVEMAEKDPRFAAGMTGELAFVEAQREKALVIPRQAVQGTAREVWVVRDGRTLARADVKLGLMSVERAEVESGLRPGDAVVISPLEDPEPGRRVRIKTMDPKAAAEMNRPKEEKIGMKFN